MAPIFRHPWGWTTIAPLACAVHCVATPVLLVIAPAIAVSPLVEWSFLGVTVLVAGIALAAGLRTHRDPWPLLPILLGIGLWFGSLMHAFRPISEELTTTMAALTVAAGLVWNSRLHCAARKASCAACQQEALEGSAVPMRSDRVEGPVSG
jgi:uncharacterized membrane protein HdeD (DUF308 family)